jgi:hypothetical protein
MWPWDHLAIGYLIVSLWRRGRSRRPPREAEALAVVVGSQFPDLVDKPLGWRTSLLPSGHSMAHSLPVAVPTAIAVYLIARRYDRADVGAAFSLAYLSHLPADVVYPMVLGRSPNFAFLLWPFVEIPTTQTDALAGRVLELVVEFGAFLRTPRGLIFLLLELTLLGVALLLWRWDGWPGVAALARFVDPRSV